MSRLVAALCGAGLFAGAAGVMALSQSPAPAAASPTLALLNPDQMARSICRSRKGRSGLMMASASAALAATPAAVAAKNPPWLWKNLGTVEMKITTANPEAQTYFNQGFRLAIGFNHYEAMRAFRHAQTLDPDCAMCYWGEALVYGPNINAPMSPDMRMPAISAATKAADLKKNTGKLEQGLIEALVKRYPAKAEAKGWAPDEAGFSAAVGKLSEANPDNLNLAVLHAETLMNLQPWDYWEPDGKTSKGNGAKIIGILESVLKRDPKHPAAIHLYIHMVEASTTPERAEPFADMLAALMPDAGHLVHMPSHIYYRIGRYKDSIKTNIAAVEADEAYFAKIRPETIYLFGYYPHNVHFVMVSAQMAGDKKTALTLVDKLDQLVPGSSLDMVPWAHPIKAAPYFALVQFGDTKRILALPEPSNKYPYVKAMWRYARGEAFAREGKLAEARAEAKAIEEIAKDANLKPLTDAGVPAYDAIDIAHNLVLARIAQREKKYDEAVALLTKAVELQDGLSYTEPPYWYYPVRQTLGANLLMAGKADAAEAAFMEALLKSPNNAWALYGLMKAERAKGDKAAEAQSKALFEKAWMGGKPMLGLGSPVKLADL